MTQNKEDIEKLMELERETYRRQVKRDLAWIKEAHHSEALMFPFGGKMRKAHEVLAVAIANQSISEKKKQTFSWEPTHAEVSESGDMGYVYGTTRDEKENGDIEIGKYVSIWVKEDGDWKVKIEIRNTDE